MSDRGAVPRGWRVRIAILWTATAVLVLVGVYTVYLYAERIVALNAAYSNVELTQEELRAIDEQWFLVSLLTQFGTPLLGTAALVAVVTLAVQARGWQLRRAPARAPRADPLAH